MPAQFDLVVTVDAPNHTAEFRLLDEHGTHLAYHHTDFKLISVSHRRGFFDLRNYLRLFVEQGREPAAMAEIGVGIAEEVLGEKVFRLLWESRRQRTLRVRLPDASETENELAAWLALVPWEIARPRADAPSLGERNLLVRVVYDMEQRPLQPVELEPDESLRVLFVFAEARGSRPLGARLERRELLRLFTREIYPQRRVVAHFLTHGVTRERLEEQIQRNNGYHVVHWSGHGHLNLLELARPGGDKDYLSGDELLELFHHAGGFVPRLVFLNACHSGDILRVRNWDDFLAVGQGKEPDTKEADAKNLDFELQPGGFSGTAHALLQGGVPSVVAMRYTVGDDYARNLAVAFYRALLAHEQPTHAAAALALARNSLLKSKERRFAVCDHATPVLYGAEQPGLTLVRGRSPEASSHNSHWNKIAELTLASHEHFVGRTWELAGLGSDFIGSSAGTKVKPVAVITGLGGMGKTALVAEMLDLWSTRFKWVLLYQANPNSVLGFEATLRNIHLTLNGELSDYHHHLREWPADAIYRDASIGFTGQDRLDRLTRNLIRALQHEAILLVLDNFETNLKPMVEPLAGQPLWACEDPRWDTCLKALASELVGWPSRVLITSRRPLAALPQGASHHVLLGPLPPSEAALYLRVQPALGRMAFGADEQERHLAQRLLNASRFHPLLMDRLARLAVTPELRGQLLQALEKLEKTKDFAGLPALFATSPGDTKELAYLNDALEVSLDQLIDGASTDARRLLWMIAVANEPVTFFQLQSVWNGENYMQVFRRELKLMLDKLPAPERQTSLSDLPPELRAELLETLPSTEDRPEIEPLLRYLVSVGLTTEERIGPEDENPDFALHELVQERIRAWMAQPAHQHDRGELTENAIRLAYGDWLASTFYVMQHRNMTAATVAGQQALVYFVQARDWDRLGALASEIITSIKNQRLLEALIPHLQTAAESAPEGWPRWSSLCYLADALRLSGQPDVSLPFYEQAASAARTAAEADGDGAGLVWLDLCWIIGNWADAYALIGDYNSAHPRYLESAEAARRAGAAAVIVIGSELGALRMDIFQGRAEAAVPEVEARLAQVRQWWDQNRTGQPVPEAPDAERLARVFLSALDVARSAHEVQHNWTSCLNRLDEMLRVERELERPEEEVAVQRFVRANVLTKLGHSRFAEAREELEACVQLFHEIPGMQMKVLGSLASLFSIQGDVPQAITQERRALALAEQLPELAIRARAHHRLSSHLDQLGTPDALVESNRHLLAGLLWGLVTGFEHVVEDLLNAYAFYFRRAYATGTVLIVPHVDDLLADPVFAPLDQWIHQHQVDVEELQAEVNWLIHEQVVAKQIWQMGTQSE